MGLHVIIGEDDYQVGEAAKKIVGDGVGLEVIDSVNSSNADLQMADMRRVEASYQTPPFLDPRKVTWWKNVHFLPAGGKKSASEEVKVALEAFARKLVKTAATMPENQEFILSGPALLKTSVVAKTLAAAAEMLVFTPRKPWETTRDTVLRVRELAQDSGLTFEAGAAERFVSCVGTDSRSIFSEFEKLRTYLNPGETHVTAETVDAIASQGAGVEPEFWAVTDAIGERKIDKALAALKPYEGSSGFAVMMTTVLEKFFRQLADMKAAEAKGNLASATQGLSPNAVRKNTGFLRLWTLRELRIARWRFLDLREKVVSGLTSGETLVICEVVRACQRCKQKPVGQ